MLPSKYRQNDQRRAEAKSDSGRLRRGCRTSPAVKVMLFQASDEKSDPVCATHIATNKPKAVAAVSPPREAVNRLARGVHKSPKLPATAASAFQPSARPTHDQSQQRARLGHGEYDSARSCHNEDRKCSSTVSTAIISDCRPAAPWTAIRHSRLRIATDAMR